MTSTSTVPLTEFVQQGDSYRRSVSPSDASQHVISTEVSRSQSQNDNEAWRTEENLPADVGIEQVNLPRADGGLEAWLFLAGCFTIEALVWGRLISSLFSHLPTL
jgi:hypothetical protein